jgi:hypothetical protein
MGNEKSLNQLIAHHSVIFSPSRLLAWVSVGPWQLGAYKCFDLRKIFHNFAAPGKGAEIEDSVKDIPPDPFLESSGYRAFTEFRAMKKILHECIRKGRALPDESSFIHAFIHTNPKFYESWFLAAEYYFMLKEPCTARSYYYRSLGCEVPRWNEKQKIIRRIAECNTGVRKH